MMQSLLCACKQRIYEDTETKNRFNDQAASTPHKCQPQPIPLYFMMYNVSVPYSENKVANMITEEAVRVGKDPYRVQVVRKGDFLILK